MSRVRSDKFTNRAATGPCTFTDGLAVTDTSGVAIGVTIGNGGIVAVGGSFGGTLIGAGASFSGNVTVGGTLTYEDVTNVDSTGIVTAKLGVKVPVDNITVAVGPSDELSLWHSDTSHSYIQNTTGTLYIRSKSDETAMSIVPDGKVDLRYDGSVKLETTTDGVDVTGGITASGMLNEGVNIVADELRNGTNVDLANGMVHLYTSAEQQSSTPNIRFDGSNTLASKMAVGDTITVTVITTTTSTSFYCANLAIDSSAVTEEWLGGSAPSAGSGSGYDVYTYNIIKTAATPTYVVLANLSNFA